MGVPPPSNGEDLGGGAYFAGGTVEIHETVVTATRAAGGTGRGQGVGRGGGLYIAAAARVYVRDSLFEGNEASTSDPDVFGTYIPI